MRIYNLTMKINRLEMLKAQIGLELVSSFDEMQKFFEEKLTERTLEEFERQSGILGSSVSNASRAAATIVGASFYNATFSQRIWANEDMLKSEISRLLQKGMIQGKNPKVLVGELRKSFDASRYESERLMRTEMARVQIEAQKMSYEKCGFEEYEYMTCHKGDACEACKALNSKHFKVKDMKPGENAPPMHPNCHCSTCAYLDEEKYNEWLDTYKEHKLGFKEWQETKTEAKKLLSKAHKAEVPVTRALKASIKKTDGHLHGLEYRFKSEESLVRKLAVKSKQKGLTIPQYATKVTDVLRYTIVFNLETFTQDYNSAVYLLREMGYNQIEVTNTLKDSVAVYRGINTLMKTPDGYVFELQFHTPESLQTKEVNHKLYEEQRLETTSQKRKQELMDLMLDNAKKLTTPKNIEKIVDIERKE